MGSIFTFLRKWLKQIEKSVKSKKSNQWIAIGKMVMARQLQNRSRSVQTEGGKACSCSFSGVDSVQRSGFSWGSRLDCSLENESKCSSSPRMSLRGTVRSHVSSKSHTVSSNSHFRTLTKLVARSVVCTSSGLCDLSWTSVPLCSNAEHWSLRAFSGVGMGLLAIRLMRWTLFCVVVLFCCLTKFLKAAMLLFSGFKGSFYGIMWLGIARFVLNQLITKAN